MERLNFVGLEADISNTGNLVVKSYVEGYHPGLSLVPNRMTGELEKIGHDYDLISGHTKKQEQAWMFFGKPVDAWNLLNEFALANNPSEQVREIMRDVHDQIFVPNPDLSQPARPTPEQRRAQMRLVA